MGRVLLVRHGQASFGADDYDVLSPVGHAQATALGTHLRTHLDAPPVAVLAGGLRRQQETARGAVAAAGWDIEVTTDEGWDEFDHEAVLAAHGGGDMRALDRRAFQASFEQATARWAAAPEGGAHESWTAFTARCCAALGRATALAGPGRDVVVVSSGGVVAVAAALLLDADGAGLPATWSRLNTVLVNTGTTTVVVGSTGPRLLTLNEHPHLPRDQVTYR